MSIIAALVRVWAQAFAGYDQTAKASGIYGPAQTAHPPDAVAAERLSPTEEGVNFCGFALSTGVLSSTFTAGLPA